MKLNKSWLKWSVSGLLLVVAGLGGFWQWGFPRCFVLPEKALAKQYSARFFYDPEGELLHSERGFDYRWRIPVKLEELPEHLIRVTLAVEDRNFFRHDGVDLMASLRAFRQLLQHGRIVSGASTITMQLMGLAEKRPRSWFNKLRRMGQARGWELTHSKKDILEDYLNHLPYGGKIYGIEAAAQYYFGRPARELNLAESILLAGIPQRPSRFRPDRHPEAARERLRIVLGILVRRNVLTEQEARRIWEKEPLRYRNCSTSLWKRAADPQFFQLVQKRYSPLPVRVKTTLRPEIQQLALATLKNTVSPGVRDAAMVVVENSSGKVRALVGTLDFREPRTGQINAAVARRSPGSALKPFIYGEGIEGGYLTAETILEDTPLLIPGYRPGNFDGTFREKVTAGQALADSLNTPVIRLLRELGESRVLELFGRLQLPSRPMRRSGLSLALGGMDVDLLSLTGAYSMPATGGRFQALRLWEDDSEAVISENIWSIGTCELLNAILRSRPLPGAGRVTAAWKTGTSSGNRDAWCIAYTPQWTVGVWFGNKNGSASPNLVGVEVAAPAAGAMIGALYRNQPPPEWPERHLEIAMLCRATGLIATEFCHEQLPGRKVRTIPLRNCRECRRNGQQTPLTPTRVITPVSGNYYTGTTGTAAFRLRTVPERVHLYVNNRYLGEVPNGHELRLAPGTYQLLIWGGPNYQAVKINLKVQNLH